MQREDAPKPDDTRGRPKSKKKRAQRATAMSLEQRLLLIRLRPMQARRTRRRRRSRRGRRTRRPPAAIHPRLHGHPQLSCDLSCRNHLKTTLSDVHGRRSRTAPTGTWRGPTISTSARMLHASSRPELVDFGASCAALSPKRQGLPPTIAPCKPPPYCSVTCTTARTNPRRPPKTSWAGRASGGRLPTRCRTPAPGGTSPVRRLRRHKIAALHGRRSRLIETKLLGNNTTLERRGRVCHPKARPGINPCTPAGRRPTRRQSSRRSQTCQMRRIFDAREGERRSSR